MYAAVLAAGVLSAAEQSSDQEPRSALELAKREFESLRLNDASRNLRGDVKLRQSLPPLETSPNGQPVLSPIQRARKLDSEGSGTDAAQSETWLIDAMRDETEAKPDNFGRLEVVGTGQNSTKNSRALTQGAKEKDLLRGQSSARDHERLSTRDKSSLTGVRNPLDAYMSQWMTPRDFELLRSRSETAEPAPSALSDAVSPFTFATPEASEAPASSEDNRRQWIGRRGLKLSLNENPYLEAFTPWLTQRPQARSEVVPVPPPVSLLPLIQSRPSVLDEPAKSAPQPSFAEQVKAQDEARFFKQLKRF